MPGHLISNLVNLLMSAAPSSAADLNRSNPGFGIALKVASAMAFTVMVTLVKLLDARYPVGEVIFARNLFGLIPVVIMVWWRGENAAVLRTARPLAHLGRALIGGSAMAMWFIALTLLPLPDATAISFSAPLITVVFAAVLLKERVRFYRWTAVCIGFVGIVIILSPHLNAGPNDVDQKAMALGAGLAFGSAVFMALATITVRRLTNTERTSTIVIWFALITGALSLLTLPFGWRMPNGVDAAILVSVGLLGGVGQILLTQSYRYADASTIAPFDYTTMLWTVLLAWAVFAELPTLEVLLGAVFVIGAGVFVIYREKRLGLDRTKERQTSTPSKA